MGYTTATHRAGIYTTEEANEICNEANRIAIEDFMVPAPSQTQIDTDVAGHRSARLVAARKRSPAIPDLDTFPNRSRCLAARNRPSAVSPQ